MRHAVGVILLLVGLVLVVGGILTMINVWGFLLDLDPTFLALVGFVCAVCGLFVTVVGWVLVRR